jgi:hypothetical protein
MSGQRNVKVRPPLGPLPPYRRAPRNIAVEGRRTSRPPYVVLVQEVDDLYDLHNMAFAAAHTNPFTSTVHWDEKRSSETAFYFMTWQAAFLFTMHCARAGIPYKSE